MPLDLLVIGDCSIDQYMDIDDSAVLHDPDTKENKICFLHGTKIVVQKFNTNLAGNACHVGMATAKLGLNTAIYTELGDDDYADKFIKEFSGTGIDTTLCRKNSGTNTNVHTIIWHAGDRTIFSYHKPRNYKLDFENMETPKWIYYTSLALGFEKFQKEVIDWINKSGVGVAFNPGSKQLKNIGAVREFVAYTDVLFVNKEEACKIAGEDLTEDTQRLELHKKLGELGAKMSVITDGSKGASVYDGEKQYKKPALKIEGEIVDKTGAGDTYAATFLSALNYGKSIDVAMDWANKNSANTIKYIGCLVGLLRLENIKE